MSWDDLVGYGLLVLVFAGLIALSDYLQYREVARATENGYEQCLVGREKLWKKSCAT